ncbi:MAG TPA: hypothetical protein VNL77_03545 [Roseiflexaceae bacterium]|nr:hypothetical protein [Roseiflexaceae bacterium]
MPFHVARWLPLLIAALIVAACGPKAPPRAARTAATPGTERLRPSGVTVVPAPAPQTTPAGDPRAMGDPNAPITVVEYSDFQ